MDILLFLIVPITYFAVVITGIILFILDGVKAKRQSRPRKPAVNYLFSTGMTWVGLSVYAFAAISQIISLANMRYISAAQILAIASAVFAGVVLLAFIVAFIIDLVKARKEGRKVKTILKCLCFSTVATVAYIGFSILMIILYANVTDAELFP